MKFCPRFLAPVLCLLPIAALACSGSEKPTYLALGDSYAVGVGSSSHSSDYVSLFDSFLGQNKGESISLRNFAVGGETTSSMIQDGQFGMALAELRFRNNDSNPNNDVFVITIDIGGNDVLHLAFEGEPCAPPTTVTAPACQTDLDNALNAVQENLTAILRSLRVAAGSKVDILVLGNFNPYSGTGDPAEKTYDEIVPTLNNVFAAVASSPDIAATFVPTLAAFEGKAPQLTDVNESPNDVHPNDDGYKVIADLLIAAYQK